MWDAERDAVRPAAVAGTFYPGSAAELKRTVRGFLDAVPPPAQAAPPKALIVPHAGYVYSGPVAAQAYARLAAARDRIHRVVLMGPSHRVPFRGIAACRRHWYETPLGRVPVDQEAIAQVLNIPGVGYLDDAHALEHSLEVQLPFLQELLAGFKLVPLVAGDADPDLAGQVLETLWGGPETLVVISSDLSHYHPYDEGRALDQATSAAITGLDYEHLDYDSACGRVPISGLLWLARRSGLTVEMLDLRSSGDTAGDKRRVVGYGAYVCH